ncbi:MAG: RibD family protein [Pseudomonadota bacterium]
MNLSETFWRQILALRTAARGNRGDHTVICLTDAGFHFCEPGALPADLQAVVSRAPLTTAALTAAGLLDSDLHMSVSPSLDHTREHALRLYLPIALADWQPRSEPLVIVHMAQSLDGRVATAAGHSQWIGNTENLHHAHRLRALVDGVLVGGATARCDKPRLDVRHVDGDNPARIILSNQVSDLTCLPRVEGMRTLIVCSDDEVLPTERDDFESIRCRRVGETLDVGALMKQLQDLGIRSLLVEGGPRTLQTFQQAGAIDWLQVHIAPMLFGSGSPLLDLPEINTVDDAIALHHTFYTIMGDAVMMTGRLR